MTPPCECGRFRPGERFVRGRDCPRCWTWHHNPAARERWGGSVAGVTPLLPRFGDDIAEIAHRFGIAWLARWLEQKTGKKCGCDRRRQWLNRFPSVRSFLRTGNRGS